MKTSETAQALIMAASIAILDRFEGWNEVIAMGALIAVAFLLRLFLPKRVA